MQLYIRLHCMNPDLFIQRQHKTLKGMFSMGTPHKTYLIRHNPYNYYTELIPRFPAANNGKDENVASIKPYSDLLSRERCLPIQNVGYPLLALIDEQEHKHNRPFAVEFQGIKRDQIDFSFICREYQREHPGRLLGCKCFDSTACDPALARESLGMLCDQIEQLYKDDNDKSFVERLGKCRVDSEHELNILISGAQNTGKSTLINGLLGVELLPSSAGIETAAVFEVCHGDSDEIIVRTANGHIAQISFPYNYSAQQGSWLFKLLDNESYKPRMSEAISKRDLCSQMYCVLQAINKGSRDMQEQQTDEGEFVTQVTIRLRDFKILGTEKHCHLWDLPGEGAAYLREEHKHLIDQLCSSVSASIMVFVINADEFSRGDPRAILQGMEQHPQIDFLSSIYVLNKAEDVDVDELSSLIENDEVFRYRKVILTGGLAGFCSSIQRKNRKLQDYTDGEYGDGLSLPEKAHLPKGFDLENLITKSQQYPRLQQLPDGYRSILLRSALPLLAALIEDYDKRVFDFTQIEVFRHELARMLAEIQKTENDRQEAQNAVLEQIKDTTNQKRDMLRKRVVSAYNEIPKGVCAQAQYKTHITKSLRSQIDALTKECRQIVSRKMQGRPIIIAPETVNDISNEILNLLESRSEEWSGEIKRLAENTCNEHRLNMLHTINAEDDQLTRADIARIAEPLSHELHLDETLQLQTPQISNKIMDIIPRFFSPNKFKREVSTEFVDALRIYCDESAKGFAETLGNYSDQTFKAIKDSVLRRINELSPELRDLRDQEKEATNHLREIESKEYRLNALCKQKEEIERQIRGEV